MICKSGRPIHTHTSRMTSTAKALWFAIRRWMPPPKRPDIVAKSTAELSGFTMARSVVVNRTTSPRSTGPEYPAWTMTSRLFVLLVAAAAAGRVLGAADGQQGGGTMPDVRVMTLAPGHCHAGLIQKEMYPGVAPRVDVYAPLGWDLYEHLKRIAAFNARAERPTTWSTEVHASPDYFERMLREHPGNLVVLSGRNRGKIDRILASVRGHLNVLADKPWILASEDLPKVEAALAEADRRGLVAYDIMTERFEVTSILQRALVNDPATFGEMVKGTEAEPAVYMESVHYLMKTVAGAPNIRPAWFFDTAEQGEGFNDIGTHLVDLVQWTLFPDRAIDYKADVKVL